MPFSRYKNDNIIGFGTRMGTHMGTSKIRDAINSGALNFEEYVIRQGDRLDVIAGMKYGDSRYWWVLAASSDIGWGLQIPPGTVIRIPDLTQVSNIIGQP